MADASTPVPQADAPGVMASLPRRQFLEVSAATVAPTQMRFMNFKFSRLRALASLFTWLGVVFQFYVAAAGDGLRRRDSPARRARRLRRAFEQRGGCLVKLGLHLSMRVDYMPWEYSVELSRMQDSMPAFPVEQAIGIIERTTGRPLTALFARFDPQPIASTSVACTYQALFHNQEQVIVRVRRPGIGEQFMADLQAFDWLLSLAEALTVFRPGFTKGMRGEFRDYLLEELDFVEAARRQDSFRRSAAQSNRDFFSAPKVYLGLSGEELVVEEFAAGMWLSELLAAMEQGNSAVLEQARQLNIVPETVARRLLWVNYWSWEENLFFHADPHPSNIILGRDSRLYYIDFTTTGALNRSQRQAFRQNLDYLGQRDPLNMARATLVLMEPLPAVDLMQLTQELETANWQLVFNLEADPESMSWEERTSAVQWMGMIQLARKYGMAIDSQVLRLLRATLLVESAAVRLHQAVDFEQQYRQFVRYRDEQARRRVTNSVMDRLEGRDSEKLIIRIDRMAQIFAGLVFRTRHMLALPAVNFSTLMDKWSFAILMLVRFSIEALALTGLAALLVAGSTLAAGRANGVDVATILRSVFNQPVYLIALLTLTLANGRAVLFRLDDKDY